MRQIPEGHRGRYTKEKSTPRTVVVQGGAYGEHRILSAESAGKTVPVNGRSVTLRIALGAGARVTLTMKGYSEQPTENFPQGVQ
jgi:hypothetical protein